MLGFANMVEKGGFLLDSLKTVIQCNKRDNYNSLNISTKFFSGPRTGLGRLKIRKAELYS